MGAMEGSKVKFASQADQRLLDEVKRLAGSEGRQLQAVLDEAMRDWVEKKRNGTVRPEVMSALRASKRKFDALYRELAK